MRALKAALVVTLVHVTLLFLPPLPPLHKGSLWSYLLGYTAVFLMARGVGVWETPVTSWWSARPAGSRWLRGMATLAAIGVTGMLFREAVPETFARFSREEGVWEPVTLLAYAGSALLLYRASRRTQEADRRHLVLAAGGFALLVLEEIDYLGIFGGMIGRIDGIYVGSLHDLVGLGKAGLLPSIVAAMIGAAALVVVWRLFSAGYVQPRRLLAGARSMQGVWLLTGGAFLILALVEEAGLFGVHFGPPSPEELLEMLGALCLAAFALQLRADVLRGGAGEDRGGFGRYDTRLVDPLAAVR